MRAARMMGMTLTGLMAMAAAAAAAGPLPLEKIALPSGQKVSFVDVVRDAAGPDGLTLRFRFLAPAIARDGGTVPIDAAQADMQVLCDQFALPRLADTGPQPAEIVISLADRPVAFGQADEAATQVFDAYAIEDGACVVQAF